MAATRTLQNNFNTGEISPLVSARTDQQRYFNALMRCENWLPLIQGGLIVRGGLKYAGAAESPTAAALLVPFTFSATDALVLEFGDEYVRFWGYDSEGEPGQVMDGASPLEVATPYAAADVGALQFVQSADVLWIVHPEYPPATLARLDALIWTYSAVGFDPPPTYQCGTDPATTLYASASTGEGVTLTAGAAAFLAADVGRYIRTFDGARALIIGITSTTVVTANILQGAFAMSGDPYVSGEWLMEGTMACALEASAAGPTGASITLTAKDKPGGTNTSAWHGPDVGKYVHLLNGTVVITSIVSGSIIVNCRVVRPLLDWLDTSATTKSAGDGEWTLEAPTWTADRGYPSAVELGEESLWLAGTDLEPDTVRRTVSGDYYAFTPGTDDDASVILMPSSKEVNRIVWLHYWNDLLVGTVGREFIIRGPNDTAITPTNYKIKPQTAFGSASGIRPVQVGNALLFIEKDGRRLREFLYDYVNDSWTADDLMGMAEHIGRASPLTGSVYQATPYSLMWFPRQDGQLASLAYDRTQKLIGWSRQITRTAAGVSQILSTAVISNAVKSRKDLWCLVSRIINGTETRTIEVMDFDRYLDCSVKYEGAATATITGLDHLTGDVVNIRGKAADGTWYLYPSQTVVGGHVTGLSPEVVEAEIGYPITAVAKTVRLDIAGAPTLQGRVKSIGHMTLRCKDTPVLTVGAIRYKGSADGKGMPAGYEASRLYKIPTGTQAIAPSDEDDGEIEIAAGTGFTRKGQVTITQDLPVGGTLLLLTAEVDVGQ